MVIFFFSLFVFLCFMISLEYKSLVFNLYLYFVYVLIWFLYATFLLYKFVNLSLFMRLGSSFVEQQVSVDFFFFQIDGLSLVLMWLTTFVSFLCFLYNYNVAGFSLNKQNFLLICIETILIFSFVVKNLFVFYVFFEFVLIPMFVLIGLGSSGRKMHASFLFFFFTFTSSVLLLLGIVFLYAKVGSLAYEAFKIVDLEIIDQSIIFYLFFFGFAAKIPLLPLHIWLPETHVEAPTVGSVILAAILLKLGAFGMFRVMYPCCDLIVLNEARFYLVPLICVSMVFPALTAVRQVDLKKIVAYSSVVHMGFGVLGFLSMNMLGLQGFLFLLMSHGLISSAMFFCVGMLYDRFHTSNILYYGGLVQYMPVFSIFFFFIIFSNMSVPGTCNFVGEFFVLYSLVISFGFLNSLFVLLGLFGTVLFCLILLYKVIFYQVTGFLVFNLVDLTVIEFLILSFLSFYILLFGIFPNLLLSFFIFWFVSVNF